MGTIEMNGTGKVKAPPDLALLGVQVETFKKKSVEARSENNATMQKLIAIVHDSGVMEKDRQTAGYRLSETFERHTKGNKKGQQFKTGYSVRNTLVIKLRDMDKIDTLLDGLADAGANTVAGPIFTIENPAKLRDKARKFAFGRAKEKAELYCELAGMKIVGVKKLDEGSRNYGHHHSASHFELADRMHGADDGGVENHIAVGEEEVSVTVQCEFEIAPKRKGQKAGAQKHR